MCKYAFRANSPRILRRTKLLTLVSWPAIIDRFVPLFSVILGLTYCLIGVAIGTYIGNFTVAGPIIQAFVIDLGLQTTQIANRAGIYGIEPKARNRVNTAYMVAVFCGQLMGTAVGNKLYAEGGWVRSGSASIGFTGAALVICFARAPWEKGWVGWHGGWGLRRRDLGPAQAAQASDPPSAIEEALDEVSADSDRPINEGDSR
jgi:hypothetical protein